MGANKQQNQQQSPPDMGQSSEVVMVSVNGDMKPNKTRQQRKGTKACIVLVSLCMLCFFFSMVPWGRAIVRSTFILPALISASESPVLIAAGEGVEHRTMTVASLGGTVYLDIYSPTTTPLLITSARSGVLVIPGAGDNRQVPQLINLLQTLARSGIVAMAMTTPALINYDISEQDGDAAVQAFLALKRLPEMQGRRAGIISFSAGVPLACLAGADLRIHAQVAYITNFGGYFNTRSLLRAFGRRAQDIDGKAERWQPGDVAIQVLTNVVSKTLTSNEQTLLKRATLLRGQALTESEQAQLSSNALAVYRLLRGSTAENTDATIASLSPEIQEQLETLSPSRIVAQISAPIFLLHDRNDASLPVTEARDFAATLIRLHHPYSYVEFHIFDHVQVRSQIDTGRLLSDGSRLFALLTQMLMAGS